LINALYIVCLINVINATTLIVQYHQLFAKQVAGFISHEFLQLSHQ